LTWGQLLTLITTLYSIFLKFSTTKNKKYKIKLGEGKGGNLQEYSIHGNENFQN
jgi:hypothetical protein